MSGSFLDVASSVSMGVFRPVMDDLVVQWGTVTDRDGRWCGVRWVGEVIDGQVVLCKWNMRLLIIQSHRKGVLVRISAHLS